MKRNPNYIRLFLGGKERGFKFGIAYISRLLDALGVTMAELQKSVREKPFKTLPTMVFESAMLNVERSKSGEDFSLEDVMDWLDEEGGLSGPFMAKFLEAWGESMPSPNEEEEEAPEVLSEEAKKKEIGLVN